MKKTGIVLGVAGCAVGLVLILAQRNEEKASPHSVSDQQADERIALLNDSASATGPAQDSIQPSQQSELSAVAGLAAPVQALLLQDGKKHNYPSLLAEINKLNYVLSGADVAALIDMLGWPNARFPEGLRDIEINAVKNDVLDKLLRQETLPEGIGIAMAEMAADPSQDAVWRDYCVQFMGPFYDRASAEAMVPADHTDNADNESHQSASSAGQLNVIREAMFAALDERGDTLAGTALIGLENLSRTHDEFDREMIVLKATEIASDESASTESRLTALRLAAQVGATESTETADIARVLAQTGETVLLRSAAIVTLGEVGSANDRELIESYALADNKQIASAAKMALAKMDGR